MTRNLLFLALLLSVTACATCKSSDTVEQCRTKQRDKGHSMPYAPPNAPNASDSGSR